MLDTAPKVNPLSAAPQLNHPIQRQIQTTSVPRFISQIYEVQQPEEALRLAAMGVDHIGGVLFADDDRSGGRLAETIAALRATDARSSLIPLFSDPARVLDAVDRYRPDIVHFCEALDDGPGRSLDGLAALQREVRRRFPGVRIMRSIPIGPPGRAATVPTLALAERFAPVSDLLLTDTLLDTTAGAEQPVAGFVGITGETCDWDMAARLVAASPVPVVLAGGISPDNVHEGLVRVRPWGVDSCTRTNACDGDGRPVRFRKDEARVARMLSEIRRAEKALGMG